MKTKFKKNNLKDGKTEAKSAEEAASVGDGERVLERALDGGVDNEASKGAKLITMPSGGNSQTPKVASAESDGSVPKGAEPLDSVDVGGVVGNLSSGTSKLPTAPCLQIHATSGVVDETASHETASIAPSEVVEGDATTLVWKHMWRQRKPPGARSDVVDGAASVGAARSTMTDSSEEDVDAKAEQKRLRKLEKQKRRRKRKVAEKASKRSMKQLSEQLSGLLKDESTLEAERSEKRFKGGSSGTGLMSSTPKEAHKMPAEMEVMPSTSRAAAEKAKQRIPISGKASDESGRQPVKAVSQAKPQALEKDPKLRVPKRPSKRRADRETGAADGTNMAKKTYAQVAEIDLVMGVADLSRDGPLEETHLSLFRASLLDALESSGDSVSEVGFVGSARLGHGMIVIKCKNRCSKEWLCKTVEHLTGLWEGAKLKCGGLLAFSEKRRLVIVAHGNNVSNDIILKRLQRQNDCVKDTSKWSVIRTENFGEAEKAGVVLTVLCPKEDAEAIKIAGGRLNCGLDQAIVRFQRDTA